MRLAETPEDGSQKEEERHKKEITFRGKMLFYLCKRGVS